MWSDGFVRKRAFAAVVVALAGFALVFASAAGAKQFGYISGFNDGKIVGGELQADGGLSDLPSSPLITGSGSLEAIAISADGKRLFVADDDSGELRGYAINGSGALSELTGSPQPVGADSIGVAITPDGKYAYGSSQADAVIAGFKIAGDGTMSPTAQGTVPASGPNALVIDGKGKHLFSANIDGTIAAYTIAGNGSLELVPGAPYQTGPEPYALALAPNGKTLYLADRANPNSAIHAHAIAPDGTLTELADSPYPTGGTNAFSVTVSPDGRNVYAGNYDTDTLAGFNVKGSGALTAQPGSPYAATSEPTGVTMSADGGFLYAVSGAAALQFFSIADGVPTDPFLSLFGTTGDLQSMAFTPAQPPKAKLKAKKKVKRGKKLKLSARKSTDDGRIIEYDWSFGDGRKTTTMGSKVKHRYKKKGKYTVKVTLTDEQSCSSKLITNGQTPYCNGSKRAVATKKIKVTK